MLDKDIVIAIKKEKPILLISKENNLFWYFDKFRMLLPIQQDTIEREYGADTTIINGKEQLNGIQVNKTLIKAHQANEVFSILNQFTYLKSWNLTASLWFVDNSYRYIQNMPASIVYNGKSKKLETMKKNEKAHILRVIYLQGNKLVEGNKVHHQELEKYGLRISDTMISLNDNDQWELEKDANKSMENNIQSLLNCDKKRCGLGSYEREMLYDIKAGHWDVFENENEYQEDDKLVPRDPRKDIKKNGIIGIDFGTKSTVVMKQEGSNEIRPIRIGSLSLRAEVSERDYENPTIISCLDLNRFLTSYMSSNGRPNTSCEDLFVSYNAYHEYINCPTEYFYAYYSNLKQWANLEKEDAVVQDKKGEKYQLNEEISIENKYINPIEVYAYYIGMYINNMRNGIYLKYIMSFPVKYSKKTKELIRKSFERGLKKSLPRTIVEDANIMSKFSVEYQISEPAAYAVTALEQSGFKPQNEEEKYLYGIFDFGGGTTDFDFGVWRGASDDEYDSYNCDYVLECFGADSDVRLGGENILEMLAYNVFKDNKKMASEKKIACALPVDQVPFIGGEYLISNSQSANRNLTLLKEALRPLWEQQDNWEEHYCKNKVKKEDVSDSMYQGEEFIDIQMYDINGKAIPNCRFIINTQQLIKLIKQRIKKGVDAFFKCIEKSILGNCVAQTASEKIYIFLAGNSCKSIFVKEIFEELMKDYNNEYAELRNREQDRFKLVPPLEVDEMDSKYIPNAKTSVAYGLIKSRPGGKIYVCKNYETNSNEETRFKYYLGTDRRGRFECKLSPMIPNAEGENCTSYNNWIKFQGAGMGIARIYYTEDPRADSKADKIDIDNIPFHEIGFEAEAGKYLFVKAIKPTTIVYVTAESEETINEDEIVELNIDEF